MEYTAKTSQYSSISNFIYKNWLFLYLLSLFAYAPFLFYFIWGNHDWEWIKIGTPFFSGLFEGRFSQFILQTTLTKGQIIPILSLSLGLLFFSLTPIILSKIWNIPQNAKNIILFGLILTTAPYTLAWLYFAFLILSCLSWPFFITIAFYLLQNYKLKISFPIATIILLLALGGYPPVINMIGIIFFSLIINDLSFNHLTIKTLLKKYIPYALSIICATAIFLTVLHFLKEFGIQKSTYNTASITLTELPSKLLFSLKASIQQFFVSKSFIPYIYKYTFLCICILAVIELFINIPKNIIHISFLILCILGLLISSILTTFASSNTAYVLFEPRIEFFSLIYIYLYFSSILLRSSNKLINNLTYISLSLIIFININTISYAKKIWKLGFVSEGLLSERIIKRIENHPKFDINKKYTFIQGGTLDFRGRFHTPKPNEIIDVYFITAPYIPWHLPSKNYKLYYPVDFFNKDFDIYWRYIPPTEINANSAFSQYVRYYAKPFPDNKAIYIDNYNIILTLTEDGSIRAKNWIDRYYQQPY